MKKFSLLLSAFVFALSASAYAGLGLPGEVAPVTIDKTIVINNETYRVVRTIENNNLSLKVVDKNSKEVWTSMALGMQAWEFKLGEKASSLEVADIDDDKIPEIITACTIGDIQSAMYIFKYDPKSKKFKAMDFGYIGYEDMDRDFMVSDIPAENGENMVFEGKTKIKTLGKIYNEDGVVPGIYTFELKNGKFMAGDPVPVEVDNSNSSEK